MRELAVPDARRLHEAVAGLHHDGLGALVFHLHPALQHVDELQLYVVLVPVSVRRFARARADDMGDDLVRARSLDAEVAVLEIAAQPAAREPGLLEGVDDWL